MKICVKKLVGLLVVLVLLVGVLFACKPAPADVSCYAYGANTERQIVDIYLPKKKGEANVILFIHGGGWLAGDKNRYSEACMEYVNKGYVTATMNYRFLDYEKTAEEQQISFADMLDDIENAIGAVKKVMIERGYTPKKLAITGESAGGHLTLLYGYARFSSSPIPIAFIFPDVGPSDFTDPEYENIPQGPVIVSLGYLMANDSASDLHAVSPIFYVNKDVPPTLLRYGRLDEIVAPSQGTKLADALSVFNVRHDLFVFERSGHGLKPSLEPKIGASYQAKLKEYMNTYFN